MNDLINELAIGLSVLRSAVIYGANASGKSNVLKALSFYKRFITDSFINSQAGKLIDVEGFRLNTQTENEPTKLPLSLATLSIGSDLKWTESPSGKNGYINVPTENAQKRWNCSIGKMAWCLSILNVHSYKKS